MKKLSLKNIYDWPLLLRILVCIILSLVLVYVGYVWHFSSLFTQLGTAQKEEIDLQEQIRNVIVKQIALQKQVAHFSQQESLLNEWLKKFPKSTDLPNVINEIIKIAASNNIHFNLFDPGAAVREGIYGKVPIKAVIVGDYHQIGQFISKIANLNTMVAVRNFSFTSENKSAAPSTPSESLLLGPLTGELNFEVYYLANLPT